MQWICGLRELGARLRPDCVVYSFGSNNQWAFELAVRAHTRCTIHTFDPTSSPPKPSVRNVLENTSVGGGAARFTFHSAGLSHSDGQASLGRKVFGVRSLLSLMRELGHEESGVDILKVDVEGAEFNTVPSTDWRRLKVGQLLMEVHPLEVHGTHFLGRNESALAREELGLCSGRGKGCDFTAVQLDAFMLTLEQAGLRLVSTDPVSLRGAKVELALLNPRWHPHLGFRDCRLADDGRV